MAQCSLESSRLNRDGDSRVRLVIVDRDYWRHDPILLFWVLFGVLVLRGMDTYGQLGNVLTEELSVCNVRQNNRIEESNRMNACSGDLLSADRRRIKIAT